MTATIVNVAISSILSSSLFVVVAGCVVCLNVVVFPVISSPGVTRGMEVSFGRNR